MDESYIFFTLFVFVFYYCNNLYFKIFIDDILNGINDINEIVNNYNGGVNDIKCDNDVPVEKPTENKYEDKYLVEIRKMDKNIIFDETEQKIIEEKIQEFLNKIIEKRCKIEEEIKNIEEDIEFELLDRIDIDCTKKKSLKHLSNRLKDLENEDGTASLQCAKEYAMNYVIEERFKKLENCYIMETTPQGNVLMMYKTDRKSFVYYSDHVIPYRYLEVAARKYIKMFNCRMIYVDMEEQLKISEEKWEQKEREQKEKEKEKEEKSEEKKNVFAKFKSYNREGPSGRVNTCAPPKNSVQPKEKECNTKILLKDKANRFSYEGKIINFNFLKRIDRKIVEKKYALSFSDFKKSINQ
jgi:hypothetical protein